MRGAERITAMQARNLAKAAMRAWESKDVIVLASLLSDDFVCRGLLPQPVQKMQYLSFMQAIMTAVPDWLFHDHFLDEGPVTEQGERVFFVTQITGTHTGDLILPELPIIPPTGTIISLPYRHLEYFVKEETITTITGDFSPNALAEILAQMGMVLP
jgi:SnoaL-like protein